MNKKFIIIALIVIIVAIVASALVLTFGSSSSETQIELLNSSNVSAGVINGDNITVKVIDGNGKPVVDQAVNMTFKKADSNSTIVKTIEENTSDDGLAKFQISDMEPGNYSAECVCGDSNLTFSLNVLDDAGQNKTLNDVEKYINETNDTGAFYSMQDGRIIPTGEISESPNGTKYIHRGHNVWEPVKD